MALSEADGPALASWLATATGADEARINRLERLSGGAIQENWALDVELVGGRRPGPHALVLRTDAPTRVAVSWSRAQEYRNPGGRPRRGRHRARADRTLRRASGDRPAILPDASCRRRGARLSAGPRPGGSGRRSCARGAPRRRVGETAPLGAPRTRTRIYPGARGLGGARPYRRVSRPSRRHGQQRVRPGMGTGMAGAPCTASGAAASHPRRLRTGNYLVRRGELTAVLDWEFAAFGDPLEDLGWMLGQTTGVSAPTSWRPAASARARRFSPATRRRGRQRRPGCRPYWEVMATVRWAVIALSSRRAISRQGGVAGAGAHRPRPAGAGAGPADADPGDRGERR